MFKSSSRIINNKPVISSLRNYSYIVLYDGVCNVCNYSVRTIIKYDPNEKFKFASMQSNIGQELLEKYKFTKEQGMNRFVYIENNSASSASTAALKIARHLSMPFPLLYPLIIIPKFIRDFGYDLLAKNRYRLFGKTESCQIPSPNIRKRFIDI